MGEASPGNIRPSTMKHDWKFKQTCLAYFSPVSSLQVLRWWSCAANKVQLVISCCISSPTADMEGVVIRWWATAAFKIKIHLWQRYFGKCGGGSLLFEGTFKSAVDEPVYDSHHTMTALFLFNQLTVLCSELGQNVSILKSWFHFKHLTVYVPQFNFPRLLD